VLGLRVRLVLLGLRVRLVLLGLRELLDLRELLEQRVQADTHRCGLRREIYSMELVGILRQ
jgi:hypothetical protein